MIQTTNTCAREDNSARTMATRSELAVFSCMTPVFQQLMLNTEYHERVSTSDSSASEDCSSFG